MTATVCLTGRFQPIHCDHLRLMVEVLDAGEDLIVAITNPDPERRVASEHSTHRHLPGANPFTYEERRSLIAAALGDRSIARCTMVPFDLAAPTTWTASVPLGVTQLVGVKAAWERAKADELAAAGYPVRVVAGGTLSSTAVRDAIAAKERDRWIAMVPPATVPALDLLLALRPMEERIA